MQRQLLPVERLAQAVLERAPLERLLGHGRGEQLEVVAAALLGPVHRRVGALQQRLGVLAVLGVEADPAARRDVHVAPVQGKGLRSDSTSLREIAARSSA